MGYTHGNRWTDEKLQDCIFEIVSALKLDHFPTHSELNSYFGTNAVSLALSRHGGTRKWAEKLEMKIFECESEFGNQYELIAISDIENETGLKSIQTKPRYPYDLLTNRNIKVDVKVSKQIFTNCNSWQNTFNLEKKEPTCDIFVLYCLDKDGCLLKRIIIPSCVLSGQTQIGVGNDSKWDKYVDNWSLFVKYQRFYDEFN